MSDEQSGDELNPRTNVRGGRAGNNPSPQQGQQWGPPQGSPAGQGAVHQAPQQWGPPQGAPAGQGAAHQAPQQWGPPQPEQQPAQSWPADEQRPAYQPSYQQHEPQYGQQFAPQYEQGGQQHFADPFPAADIAGARTTRTRKGPSPLGIGLLVGALVLGLIGGLVGGRISGGGGSVSADNVDISGLNLQDLVSVQSVADQALPAVVKIEAIGSRSGSTGSGVVLTEDGEILTNYHVIHAGMQGGQMDVFFNDGTTATASLVGADPSTDIALIKADDVSGLTTMKFGSTDDIKVGQAVVALGSPYGLDSTVTAGIISTLNRPVAVPAMDDPNDAMIYPAVQTDAAINPGNSGGALVNIRGELVGMNSANRIAESRDPYSSGDLGSIGIGWAIPVNVIEPILEQLRNGETATHAWLGIVPDDAQESGIARGALVDGFTSNSPAEGAGVQRGDVIVAIDDYPIAEGLALLTTALHYRPGDEVTLTLLRSGNEEQITVELGEQGALIPGLND